MATCDNVDDVLAIDPRPGNATSNDAEDNIRLLNTSVAALPGRYRRRVLFRLDGAGFSHRLLKHIASGGGVKGRLWEFSVGWACTDAGDRRHRRYAEAVLAAGDRAGRHGAGRHRGG